MAEATVASRTNRELVMEHVWDRCTQAFCEGDFELAANLDRMYEVLDEMTDAEYECAFECDCPECDCHS